MATFRAPHETLQFVLTLLKESAVADINFNFGGLRVRNLGGVARLMGAGRIELWIDGSLRREDARYDTSKKMYLSDARVDNTITKVAIVHETVHAYVDYRRTSGFRFGEESAAYVAERVFADKARVTYIAAGSGILWAALRLVRELD